MNSIDKLKVDMPLKHIETLPLVISVYKLSRDHQDDELVRQETLDYGNFNDRKLIGRITIWALQNGCSVETMAKTDWDRQK